MSRGPSKKRFEEIHRYGQRCATPAFRMCLLEGTGLVGIGTSRSIGSTPRRNRLKRRAREALRKTEHWPLTRWDCVLILQKPAEQLAFDELSRQLSDALSELSARFPANSPSP